VSEDGISAASHVTDAIEDGPTAPRDTGDQPSVRVDAEAVKDEGERLTIAGHLIQYALAAYEFVRDQSAEIYALPMSGDDRIAVPLDELRYPVAAEYFRVQERPAPRSAWPEAAQTLKGLHRDAPKRDVHLRHAFVDGLVVVDLGRRDAAVVEISQDGWRIVERPPVIFRRTTDMEEMPLPVRGGSLNPIRECWRIPHQRWGLVLGWLVITLLATLPAPVLALLGEQGTGKSLLAKLLVKLVDAGAPIGRPPASEERLQNAALNHRVYAIDNLSHLRPWLSDALAALVTGESDKRRKLYTDADPFRLNLKSAVMLTGITIEGAGPDLLERMVSVNLDVISRGERLHEAQLWRGFERQQPAFLGALFDLVPPVLAAFTREAPPDDLPRMADYGLVLDALDDVITAPPGTASFYRYYTTELPHFTAEEVIEGSEFGADLVNWFNERRRHPWTGTATELLRQVAIKRFDTSAGGAPKIPKSADYPRTPRGVTAVLKRLAPVVRTLEIAWTPPKPGGTHKTRTHTLATTTSAVNADVNTNSPESAISSATAPTASTARSPAASVDQPGGPFDHNGAEPAPRPTNRPPLKTPNDQPNTHRTNQEAIGAVALQHKTSERATAGSDGEPSDIEQDEIERLADLWRHYHRLDAEAARHEPRPNRG
jgi:hypothetical protein